MEQSDPSDSIRVEATDGEMGVDEMNQRLDPKRYLVGTRTA